MHPPFCIGLITDEAVGRLLSTPGITWAWRSGSRIKKRNKSCMESTLKCQPKCPLIYTRNHLGEDNRTAVTCQSISRCLHFKYKPREHTWSNAVGSVLTQKQASSLTCLWNNLIFPLLRPKPMSLMPHPLESLSQVTKWSHLKEGFSSV